MWGSHISRCNDNPLVLDTFKKAFETHKDVTGLIVHSDQGYQYTSHAYHDMLPQIGAQISMSRRGIYYDNASIESLFSHLKVKALFCGSPFVGVSMKSSIHRIRCIDVSNLY
ncbi:MULTISPECIES: DDE-type integrase/transposase/recombinase [Paenibacillus]|uniref:DDE-type integrase/transposase/recombinase n=1 Tax=Paenibacillus TaxID=44249 RepID=UPI00351B6302